MAPFSTPGSRTLNGAYSPSGTTRLAPGDVRGELAALAGPDPDRGVEVVVVRTVIAALEDPPADTYDAYLRLHLLSTGWWNRTG